MVRALAILSMLVVGLAACDGGGGGLLIAIEIMTPAGESPLVGYDLIQVAVRQGEGEVVTSEGEVTADGFDVRVEITDYTQAVNLSVVLTGPAGVRVIGGPPTFLPRETGLVVVAVGESHTCAVVADMSLEDRRSSFGFSLQGTFASALGGVDAAGPSDTATFLDLLRLGVNDDPEQNGRLSPLPAPIGPARSFAYGNVRALVLSALEDPFSYNITAPCDDPDNPPPGGCAVHSVPAGLHRGVSNASGALELSNGGVVVVGGDGTGDPSADVSWIADDGQTIRTRLTTGRLRPVLVELDQEAVLVVGGELGGAYAEVVRRGEPVGDPVEGGRIDGFVRVGGALFADPTGQSALLVGGQTPDEMLIPETELFTGCPSACRIAAGPAWAGARFRPTFLPRRGDGGLILGGGEPPVSTVERVDFGDPRAPVIVAHGPLEVPRRDASALALSNGVVFVAGGRDASGPRLDVEMCFPTNVTLP
ncbi:MAG: hypothetical protein JRH11_06585 [Deltaproteobacteria bacterium]|nr:hypothetical protein [Deltaproteobacteria bacterium]